MKVKVTTAFNDMSTEDPDTRRREIATEFDAADGRAAQLVAAGFVETIDPPTPAAQPDGTVPDPAAPPAA